MLGQMRKRDRENAGLLVLAAAMSAVSAFAGVSGEPFGWVGALFFGGSGAVLGYAWWAAGRPPRSGGPPAARHGSLPGAARHTTQPTGVVIPAGRAPLAAAAAGSAVFVLTGIGMVAFGMPVVGALCVLVFGVFGVLGLRGAFSRGQGIALLPEGVFCRMPAGTAWLPWPAIARVRVRSSSDQAYLAFRAGQTEAIALTGAVRWMRRVNRRRFDMDVGCPAGALRYPPARVCGVIRRCVADPATRAALADPDQMPPLD